MRINTNVAALNSYNQLKNTQNNLSKSLSRLSSGKRINGAADDAAGLAISEKMNSQTRGLAMAQRNAQDGISMIQTAEGALKESHSILQRMRELSVQSANDTNTEADRGEIQKEVDQLAAELTRIGETTEFNTQKLLDGSLDSTKFQIGANKGQNMEIAINDMQAEALGVASAEGVEIDLTSSAVTGDDGSGTDAANWGALSGGSTYTAGKLSEEVTLSDTAGLEVDANYALKDTNGEVVAVSKDGGDYYALDSATAEEDLATSGALYDDGTNTIGAFDFGTDATVTSGEVTSTAATNDLTLAATGSIAFEGDAKLQSGTYSVIDGANHAIAPDAELGLLDSDGNLVAVSDDTKTGKSWTNVEGDDLFTVPANSTALAADDEITISGEGGIDVSSQDAANNAIKTLDDSIAKVSAERSKLGAVQNRLDHTINNLNTAEENLTAAESRISDVDMAKEMMNMSKQQILSQAGTAMMAQANQLPQGVLQLLG
jgi:flagellin